MAKNAPTEASMKLRNSRSGRSPICPDDTDDQVGQSRDKRLQESTKMQVLNQSVKLLSRKPTGNYMIS